MKRRHIGTLIAVLLSVLLPDADAQVPKKVLRTYHDFLAVIPRDMEPERAYQWSDAQKEVANGLFKKKLVDAQAPVKMRLKVHGVDHWGRFVLWSHLPADEGYSIRVFASIWKDANFLPKLATLRPRDLIELTGECDLAKFENLWNTPSLSLGVAKASFTRLLPNGKPAIQPARLPIQLVSAVYGSGTAFSDVTDRVKSLFDEPGALFKANPNWLGADPTPGWNKALILVHQINGKKHVFTAGENAEVSAELVLKAVK